MVAETSKSMNAELDNNTDGNIKRTYSSSSKKSTTSRRSMTSKKSTTSKGSNKLRSSLKKSTSHSEGREQGEVVSQKADNAEKREGSGIKLNSKLLDMLDDEHDRILFNLTMSTDDGDGSNARYDMEDECSVGYDDVVGSSKAPYLYTFGQGTFSIDEDSCSERYNTYDETYQQVIINKQKKREKEMAAAALKPVSVDNSNQMKSTIELPWRTKKAIKTSEDVSVSTIQKAVVTPLPISCTPSVQNENSIIDDEKSLTSICSLDQKSIAHMSIAEEKPEEVAEETQTETIDNAPIKADNIEDAEEDTPLATNASTGKKNSTKKSRTSLFKKQKKEPSNEKEDAKNKKKKKGMLSFLRKSKSEKSTEKTSDRGKKEKIVIKKKEMDEEDVKDDLSMPLQIKDNIKDNEETKKKTSSMTELLKQIDDQHEEADTSNILDDEHIYAAVNIKSTVKEENHNIMSMDSIGESLGTFISVTGDKLYESYMGFGQK